MRGCPHPGASFPHLLVAARPVAGPGHREPRLKPGCLPEAQFASLRHLPEKLRMDRTAVFVL